MHRRGSSNRPWFYIGLCVLLALWASPPPSVQATHEVDHRFTVYGTVRDGTAFPGNLLAGQEVVIRDAQSKQVLQRGVTNQQGHFALVLHLHTKDQGKLLTIQARGSEKTLELQFDPNDTTTERQVRVDLVVFQ